jgi:hypothetical protein
VQMRRQEEKFKFALVLDTPGSSTSQLCGFVRDHLRYLLTHLELGAHFLDLRGLLFELGRENFHLFLLLRDR